MPLYDYNRSPLLLDAQKVYRRYSVFSQLLLFIIVYYVGNLLAGIPTFLYLLFAMVPHFSEISVALKNGDLNAYSQLLISLSENTNYILCTLFSTVIVLITAILFCRFIEKRSLASMGFKKEKAVPFYLIGLLAGILLFAASVGIACLNGSVTVTRAETVSVPMILLFFLAFLIQGASEEILLRGYFMMSLSITRGPLFAVVGNALLFALMHAANPGFGFLPFVNVFLFGLILSLLMLRTNSIFLCLALHGAWNFAEGCLFGASVSGMGALPSFFRVTSTAGMELTNGGTFGPEGGLAVTMVLILALILTIFLPSNRKVYGFDANYSERHKF